MYNKKGLTDEVLIAPCGMNCAICSLYLSGLHNLHEQGVRIPYCTGCRPRDKSCAFVKKGCRLLSKKQVTYCYECDDFPCSRLEKLDGRYREHHHMSMIDNLVYIRENGIEKFLAKERERWTCPECGDVICCHNGLCFDCGLERLKKKKRNMYRWEGE